MQTLPARKYFMNGESLYFPVATVLSLLLHAVALIFWLNRSAVVTVDASQAVRAGDQPAMTVAFIALPAGESRGQHSSPTAAMANKPAQKQQPARRRQSTKKSSSTRLRDHRAVKPKPGNDKSARPALKPQPEMQPTVQQNKPASGQAGFFNPAQLAGATRIAQAAPATTKPGDHDGATRAVKTELAKASAVDVAPGARLPPLLKSPEPRYPEEARWEERTGKVTVKFRISGRGRVLEPRVSVSSKHRDLDWAALQAIKAWRFDVKNGSASAAQWYRYSFRFELN